MPAIIIDGHQINYTAHNPGETTKPPLLLHHGFTSSAQAWTLFRYVKPLSEHFRVYAIDALGHGHSEKAHAPLAYQTPQRVSHITGVLDHAKINKVHYWGFSMGGWLGYAAALHAPERLSSLTIAAAHPFEDPTLASFDSVDPQQPESFVAAFEQALGETIAPAAIELILQNDLHALTSLMSERHDLVAALPKITMPATFYAGTDDQRFQLVQEAALQVPHATFHPIQGLNHIASFGRSGAVLRTVLPHVLKAANLTH